MTNKYDWPSAFAALEFVAFNDEIDPLKGLDKATVDSIEDTLIELNENYGMVMAFILDNGKQMFILHDAELRFLPMKFDFDGVHLALWGDEWSRTFSDEPKEAAYLASIRFNTLVGQFEKFALATNI